MTKTDLERWKKSNHICMMIMKKAILKAFRGLISDMITTTKEFLVEIEKKIAMNEKAEIGTLLTNLISIKYKGKKKKNKNKKASNTTLEVKFAT